MSNEYGSRLLKTILALALVQAPIWPTAHAQSEAKAKKVCKPVDECRALDTSTGKELNTGLEKAVDKGGTADKAGGMVAAGQQCDASATGAATKCGEKVKACKTDPSCKGKESECEKEINGIIAKLQGQAAQCKSVATDAAATQQATGAQPENQQKPASTGGGGDSMMPMLMGAAMGGLLGYMLGKKNSDDDGDDELEHDPDDPLLPNGQIDCSKERAYLYRECNAHLEQQCGTAMESARCQRFANRYCGTGAGNAAAETDELVGEVQATLGDRGEGVGTAFCKYALAYNYCKGSGRSQCPSCLNLDKANSPVCQQNPALCLAQNSPEEIEKAKQSCPTDPAFSDPTYTAGGGSQVPSQLKQDGVPVVVLPASVAAQGTENAPESSATSAAARGAGSSGAATSSGSSGAMVAGGGGSGDQGVREGYGQGGTGSSASYGGAGGGGVSTGYSTASASAGGREFASAGGADYRPSSAGPASDVQGQYGPSLFSVGTQVIRNRCQAGRLNNCP